MKWPPTFFALVMGLVLVLTLVLSPATPTLAAAIPDAVPGAQTVDADQAKQLFDKGVTFVDLRRDRKWKAGHVPGAVHLEFRKEFKQAALGRHVGKDQAVAFYFDNCRRCAKAIEQAVEWGYTKVYFFRDGMRSWEKLGYPVEPSGQSGGTANTHQQDKKGRNQQTAETSPAPAASAAEQSEFSVVLVSAGDMKIQVIKAVREITGLGLKEAKDLVDSAPKPVKEGVSKDEAFAMKDLLVAQGATVRFGGTVYEPEVNTASPSPSATSAAAAEQTEFSVVLVSAGDMKIQVIKAVREITGLGLKDAKDLVDNAPRPVREGVTRDEAFAMKEKLEAQGATVELK